MTKTTIPEEVDNQINLFFSKPEMEIIRDITDVFKLAVVENLVRPERRTRNESLNTQTRVIRNNALTFTKLMELNGFNRAHANKMYCELLQDSKTFEWENEIIDVQKGGRGRYGKKCEIWFTPAGFLQAFQKFKSPFAKKVVAVCFKISSWAFQAKAAQEIKAANELLDLNTQLAELEVTNHEKDAELETLRGSPYKFVATRVLGWTSYPGGRSPLTEQQVLRVNPTWVMFKTNQWVVRPNSSCNFRWTQTGLANGLTYFD